MTAPTFFRQLRKTTVLLLIVFLTFAVHRIVVFFQESPRQVAEETVDSLETAESVICHNIVSGTAFGVDSVFEEYTRVYFYSALKSEDSTTFLHKWFCGLDTVMIVPCTRNGNVCISSIHPERLRAGEWSVDLTAGRRLVDSKQFIVESSGY